jgi:hypothetical protein
MLCAGAVRRKNVQNTMLKNLLDAVSLPLWKDMILHQLHILTSNLIFSCGCRL